MRRRFGPGPTVWPNLFIVGAPKACTTLLWRFLRGHPEIHMSPVKEPYFFDTPDPRQPGAIKDEERYLRLFAHTDAVVRGEATPSYLSDPRAPEAIQRTVPEAKIVIVLRDPIARTYSAYLQQLRYDERRSFLEVVRSDIAAGGIRDGLPSPIVGRSLYADPVERYATLFGDNVFVLYHEDIERDPGNQLRRLLEFLEVDRSYVNGARLRAENPFSIPRNALVRELFRSPRARSAGRALVPIAQRLRVAEALLRPAVKPEMDPEARRLLARHVAPDVERLRKVVGQTPPWRAVRSPVRGATLRERAREARWKTTLSVVIPNLDGAHLLEACLRSVAESVSEDAEVILVDNGSTDRSLDVARRALPELRVVTNERNLGFARACNQGAAAAASDYVVFLNSDVVLTRNCLTDLVAHAQGDREGAAWQPRIMRGNGVTWDSAGSFFTRTGFLWHEGMGEQGEDLFDSVRNVFGLKGACLLVRREPFLQLGGFDEDFFAYFEDSDLCWRFHLAGWGVRYVPVCCAVHHVGATTTRLFASPTIDYMSFRNRIDSIVKNSGTRTLLSVLPVHLTACLGVALAFVLRGRLRNAAAVVRAVAASAIRMPRLIRKRRIVQALRTRPDGAFLPSLRTPMTVARARRLLEAYLPRW